MLIAFISISTVILVSLAGYFISTKYRTLAAERESSLKPYGTSVRRAKGGQW